MSNIAIRVENLSKQYRVGRKREGYRKRGSSLTDAFTSPFRRATKLLRGQSMGADIPGESRSRWQPAEALFDSTQSNRRRPS